MTTNTPTRTVLSWEIEKNAAGDTDRVSLILDATLSATPSLTQETTDHPIEDGSLITDHAVVRPRTYAMRGMVSNHPIKEGAGGTNSVELFTAPGFGVNRFVVTQEGGEDVSDDLRAKTAFDMFTDIVENNRLVRISYDLEILENMICTSASFPRDTRTAESLLFDLEFKQVKFVSSRYQTTSVPPKKTAADVKHTAKDKTDEGQKPTPKDESPSQSVLAAGDDLTGNAVSNFFGGN